MNGVATFKSHILRRDEKGMFGIPFKRLLFSGLGGGFVMTITKIPFPDFSVLMGIIGAILFLVLTTPNGGIPRWQKMLYEWRWRMVSASAISPASVLGQLADLFGLPAGLLSLNGETLFSPEQDTAPRTRLTDWITFARPEAVDSGDGLIFTTSPALMVE